MDYGTRSARDKCSQLLVTDAIRCAHFKRRGTDFKLHAYLNILRMRERYPAYDARTDSRCGGAVEVFTAIVRKSRG